MQDLPHCWRELRNGVYAAYYGPGNILYGATAVESLVYRLRFGVGGKVSGCLLSGLSQEEEYPSVGDTTDHTATQDL